MLDAIERVEIATRSEIALVLGARDVFAHQNPAQFDQSFTSAANGQSMYDRWADKFNSQVSQSRDEFVKHHETKYGSRNDLPIWIAIELWDFGLLSNAYSGMKPTDKLSIATHFSVPAVAVMTSWLRSLNYVRNVIAHHGRLWNISLNVSPKRPRSGRMPEFDMGRSDPNVLTRVYSICCILTYLTHVINPESVWINKLKTHIKDFPQMPYASIKAMGFPTNWETHGFWNYNTPATLAVTTTSTTR